MLPNRTDSMYKLSRDYFPARRLQAVIFLYLTNIFRGYPILDVSTTQTSTNSTNMLPANAVQNEAESQTNAWDTGEIVFELGLWLASLESFLNLRNHFFTEENTSKAASRDWAREFRLTYSTLLLCSNLAYKLSRILNKKNISGEENEFARLAQTEFFTKFEPDEIQEFSQMLKDAILLNEAMLRSQPLKFGEWKAWSNLLSEKISRLTATTKLVEAAEKTSEEFLPAALKDLFERKTLSLSAKTNLELVLPRFAKILKWLSVIKRMLDRDEPLKPALLVFSLVYEQIQETISYINNRLLRFPNEEDQLYGSLDGAAYTASIELRKVYNEELAGLVEIRSTPAIYAKIEAAYSLLTNSCQLTLVNFAQLLDPAIEPSHIFPGFQTKLEQSIILRQNMWDILKIVQKAEQNPETYPLEDLHEQLKDFLENNLKLLFYKDRETVERFVEEILVTKNKKDFVPILHRFGAYLETLFGQVNMRVVLVNHPFAEATKEPHEMFV